jgi:hypothetical protein
MEIQEETYLKICNIKKTITIIIRKEDSDNPEYLYFKKKYNEFKVHNDIRNYNMTSVHFLSEKKF